MATRHDEPTVTVWSDIGCPWAALALHTLHVAAERRGLPLLVDHRAFPLELFNRQSTPKFIVDAEIVVIAGTLPELGWQRWRGPDWTYPATTLPALEAVQAAKDPAIGGLWGSDELDGALRRAFYVESKCISVHPVILDIAEECTHVDAGALAKALARGEGRAEVYEQWRTSQGPPIQGSPHLFATGGYAAHNPGVEYRWSAPPRVGGFPRLEEYNPVWADELLDIVRSRSADTDRS
ncbi:dithiol-disulfide isomerase [Longimycelium tulufanense]|uniref:Dithiol-disulfide isomerase n=1 Tax=Longimycelium tulufanense TaxID=907463 RepID=A0A8J3C5V4_9PSEU|nr:DsbA family protein [Longimycelium tulufanense]GGM33408.1 dithiol-disulfide isomerase [Longimycelium tulufanense]